jgi:hypothetical protein
MSHVPPLSQRGERQPTPYSPAAKVLRSLRQSQRSQALRQVASCYGGQRRCIRLKMSHATGVYGLLHASERSCSVAGSGNRDSVPVGFAMIAMNPISVKPHVKPTVKDWGSVIGGSAYEPAASAVPSNAGINRKATSSAPGYHGSLLLRVLAPPRFL